MKRVLLTLFLVLCTSVQVFAKNTKSGWQNDLRTLFTNNQAIIYTINIRTFNAKICFIRTRT